MSTAFTRALLGVKEPEREKTSGDKPMMHGGIIAEIRNRHLNEKTKRKG
jgi:hypothetical protein